MTDMSDGPPPVRLRRTLTLPLLTLYGVGVTVGAGIYVLTGKVIGIAGIFAPLSFLLSALLAGLSALSFAELAVRLPRAAGEAIYVREGLRSSKLALIVGLVVVAAGTISSSAIVQGFAGYVRVLVDLPAAFLIVLVVVALCLLAIWGIRQAVIVAALFTVIEVGGLLLIIWVARGSLVDMGDWAWDMGAEFNLAQLPLIVSAAVLAFFAFIGFEDMVNVVEEVRDPDRTMPRAIILTIVLTTLLYVAISLVALLSTPVGALGQSEAPLADLYASASGRSALPIVLVGTLAIINGALIQIIMGARVLYGLADQGNLPRLVGYVHPRFQTPVVATLLVGGLVIFGSLLLPLEMLARLAAIAILSVFALVNLSLIVIKHREKIEARPHFRVPVWIPVLGGLSSAGLIVFQVLEFSGLVN